MDDKERFRHYRRFLCQAGAIDRGKGAVLDEKLLEKEDRREFRLPAGSRMLYRTHYFTDIYSLKRLAARRFRFQRSGTVVLQVPPFPASRSESSGFGHRPE